MGGSGWLATCLDCSCPARTPWSVAATHRLDKIRRRAAQPYTIVSLSIQYFSNASQLDCRQLEKENSARKNSYMHTHRDPANGRNFKSSVYSRTFAHAHGDTDAFFAHQRPNIVTVIQSNYGTTVTIGACSCQLRIASSWKTSTVCTCSKIERRP